MVVLSPSDARAGGRGIDDWFLRTETKASEDNEAGCLCPHPGCPDSILPQESGHSSDTTALSVPNAGPATQILTTIGQETSTKRESMKCLGSRRDGTAREP